MELKDNWTVLQTSKLIASYKKFPNLWDCNHKFYKNKALRKNCLRSIAIQVSRIKPGTDINDVRAKLKTLRSQYGKEKRRKELAESKRNIKDYKPKLWCYESFKFIDVGARAEHEIQEDNSNSLYETENEPVMDEAMIAEFLENDSNSDSIEEKIERRGRPSRFPAWSKEQTFHLLMLLKKFPLLYDTTHPFYANPIQRTKAFRDILIKLKHLKPNVTIPDMRAKLKTLRSQYIKEKRMQRLTNEGRGRVEYIPKLWCFEHLKFLDDRGKFLEDERQRNSSLDDGDFEVGEPPDDCYVAENENEIYVKSFDDSDTDEPKPPTSPAPINGQMPRSLLHKKCLSLVESLSKHMKREHESSRQQDEDSKTPQAMLGKLVEVELLKVSDDVFEDTKWKIIKLLEEASKRNRDNKMHRYRTFD